jgi:hypothetical protein
MGHEAKIETHEPIDGRNCRSPTRSPARRASSATRCSTAMEQAIQKAGRSKYGHEHDIRAQIDRKTGEIKLIRYRRWSMWIENEATQIRREAQRRNPDAKVGDFLIDDPLPPIDFGRIAAQTAKQVIVQKVREAERERQFDEFKDRVGEIVNGHRQARRVRQRHRRSRPRRRRCCAATS